ncbi:MAG: glycosyltransferase [Acidimicrobiaceae bacterium]|nr:glycosyltransferase [Acidimicrobiaceae bacterium]MYE76079.1 glycosyltransferase [Acidimicrobiaceae bacterium]MYJ41106.1 glycosyltransferase [Acidimicrobiaceae bacterium]
MSSAPPPARVRGNNWRDLSVTPADGFEPRLPASVVVAYYEAPESLELTLASLERQTYPRDLFEVVIVDDGSNPPLDAPAGSPLSIRVVYQEDRGFGLARARNAGARAADHEILVFLDCDMMPEEGWLAEHARWHHAANDALTLGFRAHVEVDGIDAGAVRTRPGSLAELFADRPSDRPAWIEFHMTRTRQLTSDDDDLFRVVTGGNLGISRSFFESVGGYDETFTQWGAEDTEFGYRAYTMGGLLVPVRDALCWHQGAGAAPSEDESASLKLQQAKISQLIAHHSFRETAPGRSFTVPQYVVTVEAGEAGDQMSTAEQVLANGIHDLVVWIAEPDDHEAVAESDRERVRRLLGGDPRVRFGPSAGAPSGIPAASFHITVPAGAAVRPTSVARLRRELGSGARAGVKLPDGQTARIVRTRALNRMARSGISVDDRTVSPRPRRRRPRFSAVHKLGRVAAHMVREAARIRSLRDAGDLTVWFLSWATRAAAWRIRRLTRWLYWTARRQVHALRRLARRMYWQARRLFGQARRLFRAARQLIRRPSGLAWKTGHSDDAVPVARYRLGPDIAALGPRAEAVLAASSRVGSAVGEFTEAMIVDTPETAGGIAAASGVGIVVLSRSDPRVSVPAFDAERLNPVGWTPDHRSHPVALGSPDHLPRTKRVRRIVSIDARSTCRRAHHVMDTAAYHVDAPTRAGALAALAAVGTVVHMADKDAELHHCLGTELYGLMADETILTAGQHRREAFSVAMRRAALRDHSLRARVRQLLAPTGLCGPALPTVSILLATRRPDQVAAAIETVASQTYPQFELILALHGDGFDRVGIDRRLLALDRPARVVEVPERLPLGAVLNEAASVASGSLLTKFDDDDLYGPEHLWDLVLSNEYSRAPLVGKGAEFVYLAGSDVTLHRWRGAGERYVTTQSIAGGALMITRHCFDAVMGWRPIPRSVDQALIADVVGGGHRVYRTHGMGYLLVRHGGGHTWQAEDDYFLAQAHEARSGCDLAFAGVS